MSTKVNHRTCLLACSVFVVIAVSCKRESILPPQGPDNPKVTDGQTVLLKALGKGVQIYNCKARADDPSKFEWSFKGPEANLTNEHGEKIAKHYAGPTWEANDGSRVVGKAVVSAPSPDADSIPWLLVKILSHDGSGLLSRATTIRRLNTKGGKAPASGCDALHVGQEVRVPYSADYLFYAPK